MLFFSLLERTTLNCNQVLCQTGLAVMRECRLVSREWLLGLGKLFLRWIEVPKFQCWEGLSCLAEKLRDADKLGSPVLTRHILPVTDRIEIQVAPLDHGYGMLFEKLKKRCHLSPVVGKPGQVQIVD